MTSPGGHWLPWIECAARAWPDGVAYEGEDGDTTWAALRERAESSARRLRGLSLRAGDRVAALLLPGRFGLELLHAAQLARLTLVPLNTRLSPAELAALHEHCRPSLTVYDAAHADVVRAAGLDRGAAAIEESLASAEPDTGALPRAQADDVLTVIYTSGTTGSPKGVELTSANYAAGAEASVRRLGCRPGQRWLAAMPMYHVGGLSIGVRCALAGMALVQQRTFDPERVDRSLRHERIDFVSLVPTMLARVMEAGNDRPYPDSLRAVVLGGGRLPVWLVEKARLAAMPLVATFGMTETAAQATTSWPGDAAAHPGSAGHPLPGVEVRIDAPDGNGFGEILIRAEQTFRGYFRDAERTALALRDGWLHTGDIGRLDAEGRLWVEVRRTDLIVTGGENVNPEEVEEVLGQHPDVAEAGVFAVRDELWGQRVAAAVVPRRGGSIDVAALNGWCRARLAGFKVPRQFTVVDALPRTASGKLQRLRLEARLGRSGDRGT